MQLTELFNTAMLVTDEVLTPEQITATQLYTNLLFFSKVKPIYTVDTSTKTFDEIVLEMKANIGDFEIGRKLENDLKVTFDINPTDYSNFDLKVNYSATYIQVAQYLILSTSLKNLNMFKNFGVDESPMQSQDFQIIQQELENNFGVGLGWTQISD